MFVKVSTTNVQQTTCIIAHPNLPVVVIGNVHGTVQLFSVYVPTEVKMLTEFCLTRDAITDVKYTQTGYILVVCDEKNNIFVIKVR